MWIMTRIGFFSIVEKPKGVMCIRARSKGDLENFRALIPNCDPITQSNTTDYRYRTYMNKEKFVEKFHLLAELINYDNFKNEVKKTNTRREKLYHKVWSLLQGITREEV